MPNLQSFVARAPTSFLKNGLTSVTMATPFWKRSWREDTDGGGSSQRQEFSSQSSLHAAQVSPGEASMCSTTDASTKVGRWRSHGRCHDRHVSAGPMYSVTGPMRHVSRVRHYHMRVQRNAALLADTSILGAKKAAGRNYSACVIFPQSGGVGPSPDTETAATLPKVQLLISCLFLAYSS